MDGAAPYIMVVEDSLTQAIQLQFMLENQGWSTVLCADAKIALETLDGRLPDLVLVDFHLPRMNGDEFVRRVRMNVRTRELRILMLTDSDTLDTERKGFESGADAYVPKSADTDILMSRVTALLRQKRLPVMADDVMSTFRSSHLLVVDDSPTYLSYITGQLEEDGHDVVGVMSGKEVLAILETATFDCIIVDLMMPEMSGTELCAALDRMRRKHEQLFQIVILTARDSKEDMMRGLEAGADDFVSKSSDSEILKARIRTLLRRKFLHEENTRITTEFRKKEEELGRARAETQAAETRAALAEALEKSHSDLTKAYRALQETQAQLVQSAKMASLGALVAGIAHEINNPLTFVSSHLDTVVQSLEVIVPDITPHLSEANSQILSKIRQRLGGMQFGIGRVEDLVVKLRTFSRLDEAELKAINIDEGIDSVLTLLQHKLDRRVTVVRKFCDDNIITCYPGPLNQVIMNVVANAIDAIRDKGTITVETARSESFFSIVVSDTGQGIPAAVRDRILDPFFTTKPVGEGTGLGLSISYGIVRRHGGELDIQSVEGQGTRVEIKLPFNPPRGNAGVEARLLGGGIDG